MRVSISVSSYSWPPPARAADELGRLGRAADEAGVDTLWFPDHLVQVDPRSTPDDPMLEAYAVLGLLAGQTRRVRLGSLVTPVATRPPALLVKSVTTLDVLSGGRAWFGVGAGYGQGEAQDMGLPLPPVAERFDRLEETLRLALRMWAGDTTAFAGANYRLEHPRSVPPPTTRPHPPVLVGGGGERRTLALVARYADACNLSDFPDGGRTLRHKLGVLARHCARVGRPVGDIDKTVSTSYEPGETAGAFAGRAATLAGYGTDHLVLFLPGPWTEATVAALAPLVAAVRDLEADPVPAA